MGVLYPTWKPAVDNIATDSLSFPNISSSPTFEHNLQQNFQLYLKNSWQYRTKRTGPQIAFANLGGTVTLEDYNENKYTKFTKET